MNKRRGRPRGPSDARQRILDAARARFLDEGYSATSLRAIARDAEVDHALVSYHFGSKDGLFRAVTDMVLTPGRILDVVKSRSVPERLARNLLDGALVTWDDARYQRQLAGLLREALTVPDTLRLVRDYLQTETVARLTTHLGGDVGAARRAGAAASLLTGIYFTRYLLRLEPIASMPRAEVVTQHLPAMERILGS